MGGRRYVSRLSRCRSADCWRSMRSWRTLANTVAKTFGLHKARRMSRVAERQLAHQEGLCCKESVIDFIGSYRATCSDYRQIILGKVPLLAYFLQPGKKLKESMRSPCCLYVCVPPPPMVATQRLGRHGPAASEYTSNNKTTVGRSDLYAVLIVSNSQYAMRGKKTIISYENSSLFMFVGLSFLWKPNAKLISATRRPEHGGKKRRCFSRYYSVVSQYEY
jgi:hypothetical protein